MIGRKSCVYFEFKADKEVKVTVKNNIKQVKIDADKILLIMHLLEHKKIKQLNDIMT